MRKLKKYEDFLSHMTSSVKYFNKHVVSRVNFELKCIVESTLEVNYLITNQLIQGNAYYRATFKFKVFPSNEYINKITNIVEDIVKESKKVDREKLVVSCTDKKLDITLNLD